MLQYKALLSALLVFAFIASTAGQCKGCQGEHLISIANTFAEKEKCWFSQNHLYLLKFKLQLLNSATEQLNILIDSVNNKAPAKCETKIQTIECTAKDKIEQANCHIANIQALVSGYNELEKCCGEVLDAEQLDVVFKFLYGVMIGWKQVHSKC